MSDDEGYAPAAQMLICFIFPASVQKNTDSDDRCQCVKLYVEFTGVFCAKSTDYKASVDQNMTVA